MWTRRGMLAGALPLAAWCIGGAAEAVAQTASDRDDLDRVSAYINSIGSLQGRFLQVASNGVQDSGIFYFSRNGGLRFEYDEPNPILIVANRDWVVLNDRKLKTVDRYPLSATPLKYLLKKDVDFAKDANIVAVDHEPGFLVVTAREDGGPAQGELSLIFSDPALDLKQWIITDAQGFTTTVALQDVKRDADMDPKLFWVEEAEPFRRR